MMRAHATSSPYGISLLLHGAIAAAIIIYAHHLQNPRDTTHARTIILIPDAPHPAGHNTPAAPPEIPTVVIPDTPAATPTFGPQMTMAQYRAIHGTPAMITRVKPQTTPATQTTPPPVVPIKITNPATTDTMQLPRHTAPDTPANTHIQNQTDAYFARLADNIRRAQEKPEGLDSELAVRIEFQVFADGTIGPAKIILSSGNRAFDDSVLKAIRSVCSIGARPDGKSDPKTADFRMREEK